MATPSNQKILAGKTERYLHRRAVKGIVPDEIVNSDTKRMGAINLDGEKFTIEHAKHIRLAKGLVTTLKDPLSDMIDLRKLQADIDLYENQSRYDENPEVIAFWEYIVKVGSVNHWCIHGR